jgi:hypothetical protein
LSLSQHALEAKNLDNVELRVATALGGTEAAGTVQSQE